MKNTYWHLHDAMRAAYLVLDKEDLIVFRAPHSSLFGFCTAGEWPERMASGATYERSVAALSRFVESL